MNYKYIFKFFLILLSALFLSCTSKVEKKITQSEIKRNISAQKVYENLLEELKAKDMAVDLYLASLNKVQQLCQVFIVSVEGNKKYFPVEKQSAVNKEFSSQEPLLPGGVILFSFNLDTSAKEIMQYTDSIKDYYNSKNNPLPYIALDQEGGNVNRLRKIASSLPSPKYTAENYNLSKAYKIYSNHAEQTSLLGITMNLAPVVEVETAENKDFLNGRSFGALETVEKYSAVQILAFRKNNIGSVIKHFPGNTNDDPHLNLPKLNLNKNEAEELKKPFVFLNNISPDAVLMSHVVMNIKDVYEEKIPSCLSHYWVNDILINETGFNGLVISDDIFMSALQNNGFTPQKAALMAIDAGVDVIMISEKLFGHIAKILYDKANEDFVFDSKLKKSEKKVIEYKLKYGILKYSKNTDGTYSIKNNLNFKTIDERMKLFEKAKVQGEILNG